MKWIIIVLLAILNAADVSADCLQNRDGDVVCSLGACERDRKGDVLCTELGGGILPDNNGDLYCGTGECSVNRKGDIWCSKIQGGGAATDSRGKVKCYGGCERGSRDMCVPGE